MNPNELSTIIEQEQSHIDEKWDEYMWHLDREVEDESQS